MLKFEVFNATDGISAAPGLFATFDEAYDFTVEFRQRFKKQGYYLDNAHRRINPADIDLQINEVQTRKIHPLGPDSVVSFKVDDEDEPVPLEDMVRDNTAPGVVTDPEMIAWFKKAIPGEVFYADIGGGATKIEAVLAE